MQNFRYFLIFTAERTIYGLLRAQTESAPKTVCRAPRVSNQMVVAALCPELKNRALIARLDMR